jgi:hypothetical protein
MEPGQTSLIDLDATATLAVAEGEVSARRQQGVDRLVLLLHWADLHSEDPQARPGAVPVSRGGDRLVQFGGEGTPTASELCWAELAIALEVGAISLRNQAGQALDLRHRLPLLWALVNDLRIEPWVAQKVATITRPLTAEQAALVDTAVTAAVEESPGRILHLAEAKTIEADLDGYRARLAADDRRTGVWLSRPRPGDLVDPEAEPGTRRLSSKLSAAAAVEGNAMVDDLADALALHADHHHDKGDAPTRDQLRAQAFALLLTDPHAAATLLDHLDAPPSPEDPPPVPVKKKRRPATLFVHLTDLVLRGEVGGVARVEAMGPMLLEQIADLLKHRNITVQPVIDLNTGHSVNGYEHPTQVKQRARLRTVYDVFPHSSSRATSRLDHDHPTPYQPGGPPGLNRRPQHRPLTRYHHRAKTHHGYQVDQLAPAAYRWATPHGLGRVVTPRGTQRVDLIRGPDDTVTGEIYRGTHIHIDIDYPRRT